MTKEKDLIQVHDMGLNEKTGDYVYQLEMPIDIYKQLSEKTAQFGLTPEEWTEALMKDIAIHGINGLAMKFIKNNKKE